MFKSKHVLFSPAVANETTRVPFVVGLTVVVPSVSVCVRSSGFVWMARVARTQQTDMPKICASVVDREKTLDDGFKFLINNFAGLDA